MADDDRPQPQEPQMIDVDSLDFTLGQPRPTSASRPQPNEPEVIDPDSLDFGLGVAYGNEGHRPGETVAAAIDRMTGGAPRPLLRDDQDSPAPILRLLPPGSAQRMGDDGRYQVMGEIARGGLGIVLKGRDHDLGRDVALKVLRPEFAKNDAVLARFVEEAQIGGQLQHPGMVPVYSIGMEKDGRPFFAMKLVKGRTLASFLVDRKSPREGQRRILAIFEQVCRTMAYAHSRRVVHRDIKPSNVMIGAFGEVQVVDWGLAKVLGREDVPSVRTAEAALDISLIATVRSGSAGSGSLAGSVLGTPGYLSPEQALGKIEDVDERTDVFALGAVLCEILTGGPPFTGDQRDQIVLAARGDLSEARGRLENCKAEPEIVAIALKCLAPDRAERYRDAGTLADAVTAQLSSAEARARRAEVAAILEHAKADEERLAALRERTKANAEQGANRRTMVIAGIATVAVAAGIVVWRSVAAGDAERATRAAAAVSAALAEANAKRGAKDLFGALAAAQKAVALAKTGDVDPQAAAPFVADLTAEDKAATAAAAVAARTTKLLAQLGGIERVTISGIDEETRTWTPWNDANYAAFREFGVDVDGPDDKLAIEAIRASPQAAEIAVALDDWAWIGHAAAKAEEKTAAEFDPRIARIEALADTADPDPAGGRVRDALRRRDLAALREIASQRDFEMRPPRTRVMTGLVLSELGDGERACAVLRAVVRARPGDVRAKNNLASLLKSTNAPGTADEIAALRMAAVSLRPNHQNWETLGGVYEGLSEVDDAIVAYREAVRLEPTCRSSVQNLASWLRAAGNSKEADETLNRLIAGPAAFDENWAHVVRGRSLREGGDLPHAAEELRKAIAAGPPTRPTAAQLQFDLGNVLRDLGDLKGAAAAFGESARLIPHAVYWTERVLTLAWMNDPVTARAEGKRAVALFPTDPGLLVAYSVALSDDATTSDEDKAARIAEMNSLCVHLRQAISAAPRDAGLHEALGWVLAECADIVHGPQGEAIAEFRTAIRLDPNVWLYHHNLGKILVWNAEFAEAATERRTALRVGRGLTLRQRLDIHQSLAGDLLVQDDAEGALAVVQKLVAMAPGDSTSHYIAAVTLLLPLLRGGQTNATDLERALDELRKARDVNAKRPFPERFWGEDMARDITRLERMLDPGFSAVVNRGAKPATPKDAAAIALGCCGFRKIAGGLPYFADAIAASSPLSDDPDYARHYRMKLLFEGGCLAALAANGEGEGASAMDAATRDGWRRRALEWLREFLGAQIARVKSGETHVLGSSPEVWLGRARSRSDLASVRDPEGLAKLSEDERPAWERFWAEVDRTIVAWQKRKR